MIWCRHCSGNEEVQVKCGCLDKFYVWTTMGKCVTRASSECVLISLKWKSPVIYRRDRNRWSCLFTTCPYWLSSENDDADVCCDDELCAIRSIGSDSWWPCLLLCQYVEQYSRVTSFIFVIFLHVYSASEHPSKAHTVASRASRQDMAVFARRYHKNSLDTLREACGGCCRLVSVLALKKKIKSCGAYYFQNDWVCLYETTMPSLLVYYVTVFSCHVTVMVA